MSTASFNPRSVAVTDDGRAELVLSAQRHERHNRPTYLFVVSGLVLLAAATYFVIALGAFREEQSKLGAKSNELLALRTLGERLKSAQDELEKPEMRARLDPTINVFALLNEKSREVGLATGANFRLEPNGDEFIKDTNFVRKKWRATLSAQPSEAILRWLVESSKIEGLEVSYINNLRPGAATPEGEVRWDCSVFFARIQRKPDSK